MADKNLVKSTSGVRGIIGKDPGMTPVLAAQYGAAFGTMLGKGTVVVGRDSRPSGEMIIRATVAGLVSVGINVVEIGIVPTPTVEIAVKGLKAAGGMCITASHNPAPWNALKFFGSTGEFITPAQYKKLDRIFESGKFALKPVTGLGKLDFQTTWVEEHIKKTLKVKYVNRPAIRRRKFKVVVDAINGAGSTALPALLERLGVKVVEINCKGDGDFVHEPEPIPKNLAQLGGAVKRHKADLGMACDPDADRLALVDQHGKPIGEELTLAIAVQQVLSKSKGTTVINLSTSRVTEDVARAYGSKVYYSKVGEANVVQEMRRKKAVIGGEGNGGVILPSFHAGRDSLIAAALVLARLAGAKADLSSLVNSLPKYYTVKTKGPCADKTVFAKKLARFEKSAAGLIGKHRADRRDGLRLDFKGGWVQIRTSNTEPIFRLIVETENPKTTDHLIRQVMKYFK